MSEELLPCPFCAEVPTYYQGGYERYVRCEICLTQGPIAYTDQEAVEFWNRRPSPWRNFRKERPADGYRYLWAWNWEGDEEWHYGVGDNEWREKNHFSLDPDTSQFYHHKTLTLLYMPLPAPPTAAEIEAAMKGAKSDGD